MGLGNPREEKFCQELHKLLCGGGKLGDSRTVAYGLAGFESAQRSQPHNARRLANQPRIKTRMAELADYASTMAGIDAGWALVQLKRDHEELGKFNINNYLSDPDEDGNRSFDLTKISPETPVHITIDASVGDDVSKGLVHHMHIETPNKIPQRAALVALMARIGGWEQPKGALARLTRTFPDGSAATLEAEQASLLVFTGVARAPDEPVSA